MTDLTPDEFRKALESAGIEYQDMGQVSVSYALIVAMKQRDALARRVLELEAEVANLLIIKTEAFGSIKNLQVELDALCNSTEEDKP